MIRGPAAPRTGVPIAALACLAILGGCAEVQRTFGTSDAAAPSPAAAPAPAAPDLDRPKQPDGQPAAPAVTAALPEVDDDPDQFLGARPSGVIAALGEPAQIRRDGPAEVWQYRGADCVLDLFLYETDGSRRVDYVELRNPGLSIDERRACLADLIRKALSEES